LALNCVGAERDFLHNMRRDCFQPGKLAGLPQAKRQQLRRWLLQDRLTYAQAAQQIKERWGLAVSIQTISNFWTRFCNVPCETPQPLLIDVRINRVGDNLRVRVYRRPPGVQVFASGKGIKFCGGRPLKRSPKGQADA
jgi:hypothetical protein